MAAGDLVHALDVFRERAWARAFLWRAGEYSLKEAVDQLQHDAKRDGLIDHVGQDHIQQILADSFRPFREVKVARNGDFDNFENNVAIADKLPAGASLDDFYAYMPQHSYIFAPSRELWPASSVNARLSPVIGFDGKLIKPSVWLDQNRPVEQMSWVPGNPRLIKDRLISEGGFIVRPDCSIFNLYRPPTITPVRGDVAPWLSLIRKIYPSETEHIVLWLAHRVQRPHEKINHALVLGGKPGIGKDTMLVPARYAVGPWNCQSVTPKETLGNFSGYLKAIILQVNEARDLGEFDRFSFYDHMKIVIASPPDVLRVNEKNLREYYIPNACGVVITTNHKTDGIYLSADDRRHFVAWSDLELKEFNLGYWKDLYQWYSNGGCEHFADYLANLNLAVFDPKAPPPKTQAFWEIVDASRAPEDAELADAIEAIGSPTALTLAQISNYTTGSFADRLRDRKNARRIPHRLEACGYVAVRNDSAKDNLWKIDGRRQVNYAKAKLPVRDRIIAASSLVR
jgi:hypothetical protein